MGRGTPAGGQLLAFHINPLLSERRLFSTDPFFGGPCVGVPRFGSLRAALISSASAKICSSINMQ